MQIKVETDKRINIYAIWSGKQIILCKGHKKSSHFPNKDWIVLWPSTNRENKMFKKETCETGIITVTVYSVFRPYYKPNSNNGL